MSFFTGDLRLRPAEAANLAKGASATERIAVALEAIVAKMNQPEPDPLPDNEAELQAQIDEFTARLQEVRDRLAAKAAHGSSGSA